MSVGAAKFTLEHYEHMVDVGAFDGPYRKRVELIDGEIRERSPIGARHANLLAILVDWSVVSVDRDQIMVRPQCPIRIPGSNSVPEPDVAWVKRRDYSDDYPGPRDVLFVVEVADSSLAYDQGEKLSVYANAEIREYWIVNVADEQVEVYRQPSAGSYGQVEVYTANGQDAVGPTPLVAPDVCLDVEGLFNTR